MEKWAEFGSCKELSALREGMDKKNTRLNTWVNKKKNVIKLRYFLLIKKCNWGYYPSSLLLLLVTCHRWPYLLPHFTRELYALPWTRPTGTALQFQWANQRLALRCLVTPQSAHASGAKAGFYSDPRQLQARIPRLTFLYLLPQGELYLFPSRRWPWNLSVAKKWKICRAPPLFFGRPLIKSQREVSKPVASPPHSLAEMSHCGWDGFWTSS